MKSIFKFIAFPITFIIGTTSALCVIALNLEGINSVKEDKLTKGELAKRLYSDFDHFVLYEEWIKVHPFLRAVVAVIIYCVIIF